MAESRIAWVDAPAVFRRRVAYFQIYGETGTGRTTLALSAPGPIALFHAGEKLPGIVERFVARGKKIKMYNFSGTFSGSPEQIAKHAEEKYRGFVEAWKDARTWARTVVLDTHTELWELLRLARFGKLAQVKPIHYGPVNAEWQGLFKDFREQDKYNIVTVGKIREKYVNDKPTGRMEQAGQKDHGYNADVTVRMEKDGGRFYGVVEKAWMRAEYEGLEMEEGQLDFGELMGMVTETDAGEWTKSEGKR